MNNEFRIEDRVMIKENGLIGVVIGIYHIGNKEMLIIKTGNGETFKREPNECIPHN